MGADPDPQPNIRQNSGNSTEVGREIVDFRGAKDTRRIQFIESTKQNSQWLTESTRV